MLADHNPARVEIGEWSELRLIGNRFFINLDLFQMDGVDGRWEFLEIVVGVLDLVDVQGILPGLTVYSLCLSLL